VDESDGLENRYISHLCHQRLAPKKEAPSFEGASFISETPPIGKAPGVGYWWRWGCAHRASWRS